MDRDLQNAYSQQASTEIEQQLGDDTTISAGYQYLNGSQLLMSVNQNVPTCVASGNNNGCRPDSDLRQQQPVLGSRRFDVSRAARVARAADARMGPVPRVLHVVEGDEQRRRVLLQLADRSDRHLEGLGPLRQRPAASSGRQRLSTEGGPCSSVGMMPGLFGTAVQHHIWRDDDSGHGGPADRRRRVHRAECRHGHRVLHAQLRASAARSAWPRAGSSSCWPKASTSPIAPTSSRATRTSAPARIRTSPSPTYNQITAVGEPRSFQFGLRLRF